MNFSEIASLCAVFISFATYLYCVLTLRDTTKRQQDINRLLVDILERQQEELKRREI